MSGARLVGVVAVAAVSAVAAYLLYLKLKVCLFYIVYKGSLKLYKNRPPFYLNPFDFKIVLER